MSSNRPLADFLRSRRSRIEPGDADASGRKRRTPGLKREEVAQRAGISTEWYVKLEQGRAGSPSAATVEALGRALCLSDTDREHLRALASANGRRPFRRETVPDTLHRIVISLGEPAYVTGRRFDVLVWNDAAAALFPDMITLQAEDRNVLSWMLTEPAARNLFGPTWENEARRIVSLFRASYDLWPGDSSFAELVTRMRAGSPSFEAWWAEHGIGAPLSGTKVLRHPTLGETHYAHASFQTNDDPSLRLALYTRC